MKKSGISMKRKIRRSIIIILLILIFFVYGFTLQTVIYKTESDKITEKIKIVFLSDLHNCFYGGFDQSGLSKRIDNENPDIVIFGGDVVDQYGGTKFALKIMSDTVKKYPCFYTAGNHERSRDDNKDFHQRVKNLGVKVLEGKNSKITVKNQKINIAGIVNANYYNEESISGLRSSDCYNILIMHEPQQIAYVIDSGFDLILSGHAHGGQWRLPFILEQGLYSPDQGIFPDYTNGIFHYDNTTHIISKGLARPLRMIFIPRIYNRPEFTVIEIS